MAPPPRVVFLKISCFFVMFRMSRTKFFVLVFCSGMCLGKSVSNFEPFRLRALFHASLAGLLGSLLGGGCIVTTAFFLTT